MLRTGLATVGVILVTAITLGFVWRLREWDTVWLLITITGVIVVEVSEEVKALVVQISSVVAIKLGTQSVPWLSLKVIVTVDCDRSLGKLVPTNVTLSPPSRFSFVSTTVIEVRVQLTVVVPVNEDALGILPNLWFTLTIWSPQTGL